MKRVIVDHYGGPEALKVVEDETPRPGSGEVGVRVLAAGVSFTDSLLRDMRSSASSKSSAPVVRDYGLGPTSRR